jgi:hypothetical protein
VGYTAVGVNTEVLGVVSGVVFIVSWYLGGLPVNVLQYVSPRLYHWLTYLTALWLLYVSSIGDGSFFERYLVVFAEVALAYLVANLLAKRSDWRATVTAAYTEQVATYDTRLEAHQTDKAYLQILYRELREELTYLKRQDGKKMRRPNLGMETADAALVEKVVLSEYTRMTGGQRFAEMLSTEAAAPVEVAEGVSRRTPPTGDKEWVVDTLMQDFIIRGKRPDDHYTQKHLAQDYEPGYKARTAWRAGAQEYFA